MLAAHRQPQDLVTEADAEQWQIALLQQCTSQLNAAGHGGRITRTVGEEHTLGVVGQHLIERGVRRQHRHGAAVRCQALQDCPFDAEINRHHPVGLSRVALQALIEAGGTERIPGVSTVGRHPLRQVEASHRRSRANLVQQRPGVWCHRC